MALLSRDSRTRRPSRYSLSRWNSRCSADRYRFAASRQYLSVPGTPRWTRKTSASLPVFRIPSSVSVADSSVTSQSGCGRGPRCAGVDWSQVDQRSPALTPSTASMSSREASPSRWRSRLAKLGSSSSNRGLPRRGWYAESRTMQAPQAGGKGGQREAQDVRHLRPPFCLRAASLARASPGAS